MRTNKALFTIISITVMLMLAIGPAGVIPARAASIVVNTNADNTTDDDLCTLREAITTANSDTAINTGGTGADCAVGSGTDTITFAENYTITLTSQLPDVITQMTIAGNGVANTVIQASSCNPVVSACGHDYRVFNINNPGDLTLSNLTVQNGRQVYSGDGGNILVNNGVLSLDRVSVRNGAARHGGGIGIYKTSVATITDSSIYGNRADDGNDTSIDSGGGIRVQDSDLIVNRSAIYQNSTPDHGGGIYAEAATFVPRIQIINSVISANNAASSDSGGIFLFTNPGAQLNASILNSTLTDNSSGLFLYNYGVLSATITNSIIANSSSGADCTNSSATITNGVNNIIEDNTCGFSGGTDPILGALQDNGGPTWSHALLPGSPAIDAGNATTCANAPVGNRDQRNVNRPIDGNAVPGAICDIGAFEYGAVTPVVTASNPSANASLTSLSSITVVFNQDMLNDGSAKAANNTVNYILVERGANGSFDTTSCNGGVVSDDVPQTISTANYNSAGFVATLNLTNPLGAGTYRLFICGTTSIWSVAGLELNNGVNDYTVDFTIGATGSTTGGTGARKTTTASSLPKTGFTPNRITTLPPQPATLAYSKLGDIWLEIPSLNVKSTIVGVPQNKDKTWDVSWLGDDTGWLNGTAFPTWNGNSVLTAHVTNASGLDGPFAALKSLKYGDQIIVHFGGVKYVYEVRVTKLSRPYSTSYAFQSLPDHSYLTLITCSGYNPINESYLFRRVVRTILVSVVNE